MAFPSLKEGWGLVVLEALSAELPVVATDIAVFREYLTHGDDALLVPPADTAALAGAMQEVMVDHELRARLRDSGHSVVTRFTWPESARRHMGIYDEMLREILNPTRRFER